MRHSAFTPAPGPGWDRRTWIVGLVTSGLSSLLFVSNRVPGLNRHIERSTALGLSVFLSLMFLPPVLSALARRLTLLWGYLPIAVLLVVFPLTSLITHSPPHGRPHGSSGNLRLGLALQMFLPLMTAGPVALFRYVRRRVNERRAAESASAYSLPEEQEGVWPPPPTRTSR